jgi:hypothetical protein
MGRILIPPQRGTWRRAGALTRASPSCARPRAAPWAFEFGPFGAVIGPASYTSRVAATRRHSIAQGAALGSRHHNVVVSPERAPPGELGWVGTKMASGPGDALPSLRDWGSVSHGDPHSGVPSMKWLKESSSRSETARTLNPSIWVAPTESTLSDTRPSFAAGASRTNPALRQLPNDRSR